MRREWNISVGLASLILAMAPSLAFGGILTSADTGYGSDPGNPGMRLWQGVAAYQNGLARVLVEYAVYKPGMFALTTTPAVEPTDYVYAFQVVSVTARSSHPEYAYVGQLSLGCQGDEGIRTIGYVSDGQASEQMPTVPNWGGITADLLAVRWNYSTISIGEHSPIMYYGSALPPELSNSSVSGYGTVQSGVQVPNPIPEPATLAALVLGAGGLLARRRR